MFNGAWNEGKIVKSFFWKKKKPKSSDAILWWVIYDTFAKAQDFVSESIKKIVSNDNISISEVGIYIESVKNEVANLLPEWVSTDENLHQISYSSYLYWVFKKMQKAWFSLNRNKFKKVPKEHWADVFNILQDKALTTFFMLAKWFWILDFTKNNFEIWEKENEIKVLETSYEEVSVWLEKWKKNDNTLKKRNHRDAKVIDHYYDDKNLRLDRQKVSNWKRSIRIRTKQYNDGTSENFYTIKRKITPDQWIEEARECYEKEYKIHKKNKFKNFLELVWMRNSRSKVKDRKSYSIEFEFNWKVVNAKIDIDKYFIKNSKGEDTIPEFIEIECDDNDAIQYIIKKLGLERKDTLITWSRWLFEHYWVKDAYDNNYTVNEESWEIIWNDWEVWSINSSPLSIQAA